MKNTIADGAHILLVDVLSDRKERLLGPSFEYDRREYREHDRQEHEVPS